MKLHVFRNRLQMIVTLMFFLDFPSAASSQQIAECTKPPGGKVTCEKGQLARCAVNKEGEVDGSCKTPPPKMTSDEIKAWTLSEVLGKRVHIEDLQKDEYKTILRNGRAEVDGKKVTFSAPAPKEMLGVRPKP